MSQLDRLKLATSRAEQAHERVVAARAAVQTKRAEVRTRANQVHADLVSLRQVLRMILGPTHADCQRLRIGCSKASAEPPVVTATSTAPTTTQTAAAAPPSAPSNGAGRPSVG